MSIRKESKAEGYDVIVIGSGIAGLSAAAMLAHAGRRVLIVERHDRPGGYAHSFKRKGYVFDAAVHLVGGCEPTAQERGALIDATLRCLGVRECCRFVRVDPFYRAVYPDCEINAPLGRERFLEAHAALFPGQRDGLRRFLDICAGIRDEATSVPQRLSLMDMLRMPRRFPLLVRYHRATLAEVMDSCLDDDRMKSVLATLWPYLGLPPSRLSFLYWAMMLMSYLEEGAYYCQGSFQRLADALVVALKAKGGELLLNSLVRRIVVSEGRAAGVVLENGQRIEAPVVISNGDARQTLEQLVGPDYLPHRYLRRLRRMRPALSAFVVYTATDLDLAELGACHEMFFNDSWDHEEAYRQTTRGEIANLGVTVPTLVDASLAPAGEHVVVLTTLVPYQVAASWRAEKARRAEALLAQAERRFPGFRDRISFAEGATPRTMERYTLNLTGSIYGWETAPDQVGTARLAQETPVEGLYLAGHWTRPGGGIYAVFVSGLQAASLVLGCPGIDELLGQAAASVLPDTKAAPVVAEAS